MTHQKIFAALLCGALLLSGCAGGGGAPAASSAPGSSVEAAGRPLSELEQIALQVEAWEKAGAYDDEGAYREALLRVLELARAEDDGSYRCEAPQELGEEELAALTLAGEWCHYVYTSWTPEDPFSDENLPDVVGLLLYYACIQDHLDADVIYNQWGSDPTLPSNPFVYISEADLLAFLEMSVAPAAEAFRTYAGDRSGWNWYPEENGWVYVGVPNLVNTLLYHKPDLTDVEPLGGNRYLIICDMSYSIPMQHITDRWLYQMAYVVEENDRSSGEPRVVILDCVNGAWEEPGTITPEQVDALREKYTVAGDPEAVDLLERLESLSPVPYHTELAEQLSPAVEQALVDAKITDDMISGDIFESYVQALRVAPTMHRYSLADEWQPADPDRETTYGGEWNLIPASELEAAFQRRLNMDLTVNGRAWLDNREFVPLEFESQQPIVQYDGENYIVYLRGIGYAGLPRVISLTYDYYGTYTAVFTDLEYGGIGTIRLRNIGTEEEPFFQLQGYELPE